MIEVTTNINMFIIIAIVIVTIIDKKTTNRIQFIMITAVLEC